MTDKEIEASVLETVRQVWDEGKHSVPLIWTYCTECGLDSMKQRCLGILTTCEALCARHFALRRIDEMRRERDAEARHELCMVEERKMFKDLGASVARQLTNNPPKEWRQPKLDVDDFARL